MNLSADRALSAPLCGTSRHPVLPCSLVTAVDPAAGERRRAPRAPALVAAAALLVYNANGRVIASSDTRAARFLPFALLEAGTLRLDPVLDAAQTSRRAYWVQP